MINEVRNTVLSVLNKNNYGYISPSDFNLYAENAQMEIFDEYFGSYNKTINAENARLSGTDYANMEKPLAELLESFLRIDNLVQVSALSNTYYFPSRITTGYDAYLMNKVMCYSSDGLTKLGEAEKVSNSKIDLLVSSSLTAPTTKYPSYTISGNIITIYPETINGISSVKGNYFTYPKPPKWTYITLINGEPAFDQSQPDYQDFELPSEDGYKLVMKILQYCGLSIRENEVVGYAINEEMKQQPSINQ
jgi:hypothetical protein